jgi:hypothetical protein
MLKVSDESRKTYDLLSKHNSSFDKLPDEEKEKVKHLLFILDSFSISDGAYHDLTLLSSETFSIYNSTSNDLENQRAFSTLSFKSEFFLVA